MVINKKFETSYIGAGTLLKHLRILGIEFYRDIEDTMKHNELRLTGNLIHELTKYQNYLEMRYLVYASLIVIYIK